jgi:hypothetical protein
MKMKVMSSCEDVKQKEGRKNMGRKQGTVR